MNVISALFDGNGVGILIEFNKATNRGGGDSCTNVFATATVQSFGTSPTCFWKSDEIFVVKFGTNAIIVPPGTVTVKANTVRPKGITDNAQAFSGAVTVNAPADNTIITPDFSVSALTEIGSCSDLEIFLTGLSGNANRDWKLVTYDLVGITNNDIKTQLSSAATQKSTLFTITSDDLPKGVSVTFSFTFVNWFDKSTTRTHTVDIKSFPLPEVSLTTITPLKIDRDVAAVFAVKIDTPSCLTSTLGFSWEVLSNNLDLVTSGARTSGNSFFLPKNVLTGGATYNLKYCSFLSVCFFTNFFIFFIYLFIIFS